MQLWLRSSQGVYKEAEIQFAVNSDAHIQQCSPYSSDSDRYSRLRVPFTLCMFIPTLSIPRSTAYAIYCTQVFEAICGNMSICNDLYFTR
jgi:hypothetical protein